MVLPYFVSLTLYGIIGGVIAVTREPLTRLRVVALALEIIDAEGLSALNMRRLATAAGVKPMSLYHHFPSKEAILLGVAESTAAAPSPSASATPRCSPSRRRPRPSSASSPATGPTTPTS